MERTSIIFHWNRKHKKVEVISLLSLFNKKLIWIDLNLSDAEFVRQKNALCFIMFVRVLLISLIPSLNMPKSGTTQLTIQLAQNSIVTYEI